jgi:two-component system, NtrC family, response regulator AtoC
MSRARVLVVEDEDDLRRILERCLVREGCEVTTARDGREGIERLNDGLVVDLILTDLQMPRADGRQVLAAGMSRRIPVIILTGQADVQTAVEMMRGGAANFLTKPFSPATLRSVLDDAFGPGATLRPKREVAAVPHVVGEEEGWKQLLETVQAVAETDATVLITGESGTGKEVVARSLHGASRRASGPFVAVNCGAIPEALLESELFGHAKGAFTGATHSRAGRLQLADRGTLFLDEIGDMPLAFQVKLLRVLQERTYETLGDGVSRTADVRVIAATHRDLVKMVADGSFREDLYYRLNVIDLHLPPLRERRGDIVALAQHFLEAANARHGRNVSGMSPELLAALQRHGWPGNIRELANVVERMVILKRGGRLELSDLPPQLAAESARSPMPAARAASQGSELPESGIDLRQAVAEYEESLIEQALSRTGGNRNAAAQLLGLNRTTLVEKLKRMRTEP